MSIGPDPEEREMSVWSWRYESIDGTLLHGNDWPRPAFTSQAEAESWIGESWRELLDAGAESVTLLCDGEAVYSGMSLRPLE
jgi:hypothetical protein